jgi:hypothetical protein
VLALPRRHTQLVDAPDRYEPMPGLAELPGWLWRRTGPGARVAAGGLLLFVIVAVAVLAPSISSSRHQRAVAEQRAEAAQRAPTLERLQQEQRPHFARSDAGARPKIVSDMSASILTDARGRVAAHRLDGPILRVECEPFPRTVGGTPPELDPSVRSGRYSCVAVTAEIARSQGGEAGAIGHPYRAMVDFRTGRYAFCKISGRPDPTPDPKVVTPPACGG